MALNGVIRESTLRQLQHMRLPEFKPHYGMQKRQAGDSFSGQAPQQSACSSWALYAHSLTRRQPVKSASKPD